MKDEFVFVKCYLLVKMMQKTLFLKYVQIASVVSLYWVVSITTVFVNKTLLSNQNLDAPCFVMLYQCFVSVVICLILKSFNKFRGGTLNFPSGSPFRRDAVYNVLPVSVLLTSMILFNAICLKYVGVSFYFISRSLTTIFNVIMTYLILKEGVSLKTLICCSIIVGGFFLGIDQENDLGTFSFLGTLSGLLSSLSLAFYSVYTKKVLPFVENSVWLLSYYNNMYSCIILSALVILSGEISTILSYEKLSDPSFWLLMTIGGISGFSINSVTSLQIKVTSPLTHNISGTAKACVQTVLATTWYHEQKSFLWWMSNCIILAGSFAYARVKHIEMVLKSREPFLKM